MAEAKPKIGKHILETLTSGMYENPLFIYREYVQNAADQIDIAVEERLLKNRVEGKINITVNSIARCIIVEDNATGIKSSNIRRFLSDVANSEKDMSKRKGFRGIGRLGGLGYCKRLVFETSYKGEATKSIMSLNAESLKAIIANKQDDSDAAQAISVITTIDSSKEPADSHFFKVTLFDVTNEEVLNIDSVKGYLSMIAPVSFSKDFTFKDKIKKHFLLKNLVFDEYNVKLNNTQVYKAYKNFLKNSGDEEYAEITSIGFFDVRDEEEQLLGVGWYGISSRLNEVIDKSNIERGIRIRKSNIAIGNEQTLFRRFKVERTNLRYIGEVHVIGDGFIPNARRDYFNDNKTVEQFETALDEIFKDFENKLPHRASDLHNRLKNIIQFRELTESYRSDVSKFRTSTEQEQRLNEVLGSLEVAKKAENKIDNIKTEAESNPQLSDLFESIVGEYDYVIDEDSLADLYAQRVYPPLTFSKVNKEQERVLNEVVIFLQKELGHKKADTLIAKLQKRYN